MTPTYSGVMTPRIAAPPPELLPDGRPVYSDADIQRFVSKFRVPADVNDCWEWTDALTASGHAQVSMHGTTCPAYRVSYQMFVGPIPDELTLDHLCRNRACVNPTHVEPVTIRENTLRGIGPSSVNAAKTHCLRGHEFTPENIYWGMRRGKRPFRVCRICMLEWSSRQYLKRKESRGIT
jgi:hypothetical protein